MDGLSGLLYFADPATGPWKYAAGLAWTAAGFAGAAVHLRRAGEDVGRIARVLAVLFVWLAAWSATYPMHFADDPDFVLLATSLAEDGDVEVIDEMRGSALRRFYGAVPPGAEALLHLADATGVPEFRWSYRLPGFGILMAPVHLAGALLPEGAWRLRQFLAALLLAPFAAGAAAAAGRIAARWAGPGAGRDAALLAGLSAPLQAYACRHSPEVVGAFLVAFLFDRLLRDEKTNVDILLFGLGVGALPLFHPRFASASLGLVLAAAGRLRVRAAAAAAAAALCGAAAVALSLPATLQFRPPVGRPGFLGLSHVWQRGFSLGFLMDSVPAYFLDLDQGLLGIATGLLPGLAVFFLPAAWRDATGRRAALVLLCILLPPLSSQVWGGNVPLGRYLVLAVPLLAAASAWALRRAPRWAAGAVLLTAGEGFIHRWLPSLWRGGYSGLVPFLR